MTGACTKTAAVEKLFQGHAAEAGLENHVLVCGACQRRFLTLFEGASSLNGSVPGGATLAQAAQPATVVELARKLKAQRQAARDVTASGRPASVAAASLSAASVASLTGTNPPKKVADQEDESEELEQKQLGPYRLVKMLGAGGMGMVYKAVDVNLDREVALKVMKPSLAKSKNARERFLQEARSAAKVHHDHIVPIYFVDEEGGVPFLAMQLLEGLSLAVLLKRQGPLKIKQVLRLGQQIAAGLAAAHEGGLVHRDIKPGNIWIEPVGGGRAKLLDFGLARLERNNANLTQSGAIVGTPAYMAPEQARGEKNVDARADLFSLGVVLYQMCTGKVPFGGEDVVSILMAVAMHEPKPPAEVQRDVPPALSSLVMKLLAKEPARRPATAREVVKALKDIERDFDTAAPGDTAQLPTAKPLPAARSVPALAEPAPANSGKSPDRRKLLIGGGVAAVVLLVIVAIVWPKGGARKDVTGKDPVAKADGGTQAPPKTDAGAAKKETTPVVLPPLKGLVGLRFAGKDYVETAPFAFDLGGPYTLEAIVTPLDRMGGRADVVNLTRGCSLEISNFGRPMYWNFSWRWPGAGLGGPGVEIDKRVHVATVNAVAEVRLFVNGKHIGAGPANLPRNELSLPLTLGRGFIGVIHEVRVSSSARYDKDFTPPSIFTAAGDVMALYRCDEGQGDVLKDLSGKGRHGKIVGATWVK